MIKKFNTSWHTEGGSPYPFWLDLGYIELSEHKAHFQRALNMLGHAEGDIPACGSKVKFGRSVLMFRTEEDRTLFEVSSDPRTHRRIDPPSRA